MPRKNKYKRRNEIGLSYYLGSGEPAPNLPVQCGEWWGNAVDALLARGIRVKIKRHRGEVLYFEVNGKRYKSHELAELAGLKR